MTQTVTDPKAAPTFTGEFTKNYAAANPADGSAPVTASNNGTDDDAKPGEKKESWFGGLWTGFKKFFGSFGESGGVGKIIGGLVGLCGAWFAGNFFGGGIMSTILTVCLAIPFMMGGSTAIGGWINGMLGYKSDGQQHTPEEQLSLLQQKTVAVQRVLERKANEPGVTADVQRDARKQQEQMSRTLATLTEEAKAAKTDAEKAAYVAKLGVVSDRFDTELKKWPGVLQDVARELQTMNQGKASPSAEATGTPATPAAVAPKDVVLTLTNEEMLAMQNVKIDHNLKTDKWTLTPATAAEIGKPGVFSTAELRNAVNPGGSSKIAGVGIVPSGDQFVPVALPTGTGNTPTVGAFARTN